MRPNSVALRKSDRNPIESPVRCPTQLVATPAHSIAVGHVLLTDQLGLVVLGQIDGDDVAIGRLAEQALLRRQANARLAGRIEEPQVVAAFEHQLVGVARRVDEADQGPVLATCLVGLGVDLQRIALGLFAIAVLDERDDDAERLRGIANRVARSEDRLSIGRGASG